MELQIKSIQKEKGITNLMLAERLGVTPQYAGAMANGKVGASIDKYEKIAEALGVRLWQLFAPQDEYILRNGQEDATDSPAATETPSAQGLPFCNDGSTTDTESPQEAPKESTADRKPDLILIDRETGEPTRYVRMD